MNSELGEFVHNALDKIEHTSTVDAFYHSFTAVLGLLMQVKPWLPETYLATRFVYGLQPEYQLFVLKFHPVTILAAYCLAKIYEDSIGASNLGNQGVIGLEIPDLDPDSSLVLEFGVLLTNALDQITHTSSVEALYHRFQTIKSFLASAKPWLPESYFADRFVYCLQEDYQLFVFKFHPRTVMAAYRLALIYEESIYLQYFPESVNHSEDPPLGDSVVRNHSTAFHSCKAGIKGEESILSVSTSPILNKGSCLVENGAVDTLGEVVTEQRSISAHEVVYMDSHTTLIQLPVIGDVADADEPVRKSPGLEGLHANELPMLILKEPKVHPPDEATILVNSRECFIEWCDRSPGITFQISRPTNVCVASFVTGFYAIPRRILGIIFKLSPGANSVHFYGGVIGWLLLCYLPSQINIAWPISQVGYVINAIKVLNDITDLPRYHEFMRHQEMFEGSFTPVHMAHCQCSTTEYERLQTIHMEAEFLAACTFFNSNAQELRSHLSNITIICEGMRVTNDIILAGPLLVQKPTRLSGHYESLLLCLGEFSSFSLLSLYQSSMADCECHGYTLAGQLFAEVHIHFIWVHYGSFDMTTCNTIVLLQMGGSPWVHVCLNRVTVSQRSTYLKEVHSGNYGQGEFFEVILDPGGRPSIIFWGIWLRQLFFRLLQRFMEGIRGPLHLLRSLVMLRVLKLEIVCMCTTDSMFLVKCLPIQLLDREAMSASNVGMFGWGKYVVLPEYQWYPQCYNSSTSHHSLTHSLQHNLYSHQLPSNTSYHRPDSHAATNPPHASKHFKVHPSLNPTFIAHQPMSDIQEQPLCNITHQPTCQPLYHSVWLNYNSQVQIFTYVGSWTREFAVADCYMGEAAFLHSSLQMGTNIKVSTPLLCEKVQSCNTEIYIIQTGGCWCSVNSQVQSRWVTDVDALLIVKWVAFTRVQGFYVWPCSTPGLPCLWEYLLVDLVMLQICYIIFVVHPYRQCLLLENKEDMENCGYAKEVLPSNKHRLARVLTGVTLKFVVAGHYDPSSSVAKKGFLPHSNTSQNSVPRHYYSVRYSHSMEDCLGILVH